MGYHFSLRGFPHYWQMLGSEEARATGGHWRYLIGDPKSLLRAALQSFR